MQRINTHLKLVFRQVILVVVFIFAKQGHGQIYQPTTYTCVTTPPTYGTPAYPAAPLSVSSVVAELWSMYLSSPPHSQRYQCSWAGFANVVTSGCATFTIQNAQATDFYAVDSRAYLTITGIGSTAITYNSSNPVASSGTISIQVPSGTNLSGITISGYAMADGSIDDVAQVSVGSIVVTAAPPSCSCS